MSNNSASFMLTCSRHVGSFHLATSGTIFENDLLTSFNKVPLVERQLHSGQRSFNIMNGIFQHSTMHDKIVITLQHIFRTVIGVRVIRNLHNCVSYVQLPPSALQFFSFSKLVLMSLVSLLNSRYCH